MKLIFAIFFPISLYFVGLYVSVLSGLSKISFYYYGFIIAYFFSFLLFYFLGKKQSDRQPTITLLRLGRVFVIMKIITTLYYFLVFLHYFILNGYTNIRGYMVSDAIQSSPFYISILMYVDSYIAVPLNFYFLLFFYKIGNNKYFNIVLWSLIFHYAVFFASRGIFYNFIILGILYYFVFQKIVLKQLIVFPFLLAGIISISTLMHVNRDDSAQLHTADSSVMQSLTTGILFYHIVPPLILDSITENSPFFKEHTGYGFATFGFITDNFALILPVDNPKQYMPAKILSAEAQNYLLDFADQQFNALATLFYAAVFDFGFLGPIIYGVFFGALLGWSLKSGNNVGQLIFVLIASYVYFGAFMFNITGEWFFVLLLSQFFIRKKSKSILLQDTLNVF